MKTTITPTSLPGVLIIEIDYFKDKRGFFIEPWNKRTFADEGFTMEFVQEGHSKSEKKTLRGLHYQDMSAPMGKLVRCTRGEIFDVAVDLRIDSPTFGKWLTTLLSAENMKQIYIPEGFAHGFVAVSKIAEVQYKQTGYYTPEKEGTIIWNDKDLKIPWPVKTPFLSTRDQNGQTFSDYKKSQHFTK